MKFKVGDKVKFIGTPKIWEHGTATVRAIRSLSETPYTVLATSDSKGIKGAFYEHELELLQSVLPADATERKKVPLGTGVLDYFPAALAEVAKVSYAGNQQHNPGEPLHWARGKSTDQVDTMLRHFLERGTLDSDGVRHSAKMCWRALAILQLELEAEGYPVARGAKQ
jgi:Domain of unknown function (DUF5664)